MITAIEIYAYIGHKWIAKRRPAVLLSHLFQIYWSTWLEDMRGRWVYLTIVINLRLTDVTVCQSTCGIVSINEVMFGIFREAVIGVGLHLIGYDFRRLFDKFRKIYTNAVWTRCRVQLGVMQIVGLSSAVVMYIRVEWKHMKKIIRQELILKFVVKF